MTRTEVWLTEMMCHFKSIDDMRRYYEHLVSLPNCNTCKRKDCEHKPKFGEDVRFNCFAYTDEEPKDEPQTNKDFKVTYTCSFTECDNFKNFGFGEKCIECKRKQSEAKHKDEPQTDCPWK